MSKPQSTMDIDASPPVEAGSPVYDAEVEQKFDTLPDRAHSAPPEVNAQSDTQSETLLTGVPEHAAETFEQRNEVLDRAGYHDGQLGSDSEVSARFTSLFVAIVCSLFVLAVLNWAKAPTLGEIRNPDNPASAGDLIPLILQDSTPSGGDMGAHVWGPAYMRDNLLPQGRVIGWTPDWYAGFPAYQFYMVVPALAMIALNVGLPWYLAILTIAGVGYLLTRKLTQLNTLGPSVSAAGDKSKVAKYLIGAAVIAVAAVGFPYGIAFKIVSVSGLVMFPIATWFMARLAGAKEPIPGLLSIASLVFLFDTNFSITGGNVLSTLAGEFSFSISLCLSLVAIGMLFRALDEGIWRGRSAVVAALVPLCHIIPAFYFAIAAVLILFLARSLSLKWYVANTSIIAGLIWATADGRGSGWLVLFGSALVGLFIAAVSSEELFAKRIIHMAQVAGIAMLLAAFWIVPFVAGKPYFNDMGWDRLEDVLSKMLTGPMRIALVLAVVGLLVSFFTRERLGLLFGSMAVISAVAVANAPEGPLWNERLLPFFYISVYFTAAIGLGQLIRFAGASLSGRLTSPDIRVLVGGTSAALVVTIMGLLVPMRWIPEAAKHDDPTADNFGEYRWSKLFLASYDNEGNWRWLWFESKAQSSARTWINWNYSGYEQKPSYREYRDVVQAMAEVGETEGCGRAMWEYHEDLDRYGTPMALMLLPHWTDGCISSMEGLYFESSMTTPFHFLNQSRLSEKPSRAQRDMPYKGFDIEAGIAQLQTMGVRYYMATTDTAIAAADQHADLTKIREAQPFVIYLVNDAPLVEGLNYEPVIVDGLTEDQVAGDDDNGRFYHGWLGEAVRHYNDPLDYLTIPAEGGPQEWQTVESLQPTDGRAVESPAIVSNVALGSHSLSFDVDQVGKPVMVKISYHPNWEVDGAEGPWRAGPNMMVIVPTDTNVSMNFGRGLFEILGSLMTIGGIAILLLLYRNGQRRLAAVSRPEGNAPTIPVLASAPPFLVRDRSRTKDADLVPNEHATRVPSSSRVGPKVPVEDVDLDTVPAPRRRSKSAGKAFETAIESTAGDKTADYTLDDEVDRVSDKTVDHRADYSTDYSANDVDPVNAVSSADERSSETSEAVRDFDLAAEHDYSGLADVQSHDDQTPGSKADPSESEAVSVKPAASDSSSMRDISDSVLTDAVTDSDTALPGMEEEPSGVRSSKTGDDEPYEAEAADKPSRES